MMDILDMFTLGTVISNLGKYFKQELQEEDFWDLPLQGYQFLSEQEKEQSWFMVNPDKVEERLLSGKEQALILSEREKSLVLKAFIVLKNYSKDLPAGAHFKERLLIAKTRFPPVFFSAMKDITEDCKVISFNHAS